MKYLSLFSGIGGFELGINQAYENHNRRKIRSKKTQFVRYTSSKRNNELSRQFDVETSEICIGFSEIDKYAIQIYQKHFPNHKNYGDITKIDETKLPDFDLLVGGFPCQSFSIAGKRKGFADTRGTLFFDIARILKCKQPKNFILENVKGLLSHDNGGTFRTIISTLDELGYDLQWQVLNSKNFGVPQNRERVFIVGHLKGTPRPQVFPFGESDSISETPRSEKGKNLAHTLRAKLGGPDLENSYYIPEATKQGYAEAHIGDSINLSVPNSSTRRGRIGHGIAQTLDTGMQQHTLTEDMQIRRLTPLECERLQGFPDNWTDIVSDTQRYKCCGNAVTVNVVQAVMEKLLT